MRIEVSGPAFNPNYRLVPGSEGFTEAFCLHADGCVSSDGKVTEAHDRPPMEYKVYDIKGSKFVVNNSDRVVGVKDENGNVSTMNPLNGLRSPFGEMVKNLG